MCVDHSFTCSCGKDHASFNFRNDILPAEIVTGLYCPACSPDVKHDPATMLSDNGWMIEFNMDIARFMLSRVADAPAVTPEFVFDEGYCTWRGVTPSDHIDSAKERTALAQLAHVDPRRYVQELKTWANTRMERLGREGWRKANEREPVGA